MKWAIEILNTTLAARNLKDLLAGLGFQLVPGIDTRAIYSPVFDDIESASDVHRAGIRLQEAFAGAAAVDREFKIGVVLSFTDGKPKRHIIAQISIPSPLGAPSLMAKVSPPSDLSEQELKAWVEKKEEAKYQAQLEHQRLRLEPAYVEPRAVLLLDVLSREPHTGDTLYKAYELMEGHPGSRAQFHAQFGIAREEWERFQDVIHKPEVSGDFARHAYRDKPRTANPMSPSEADRFIRQLADKWLESVRTATGQAS